ncbi:retrotransposon protein, putative, ty1-copia subclass [Tanacetum coccineum]
MVIQGDRIQKYDKKSLNAKGKDKEKGKGKDKSYIPKPKNPKPSAKEHPTNDDAYHHYKEVGHYKRNCPAYLVELIKKKKQVGTASSSDMCQDKVFKNEVENQLGKTIKALRSDRGGEYISQKFKDYLKACGIVQQLTPPYTPQHNGVSERRNRTLLGMVRSMMNLTTLSLSFWDYTLETATRILNMVPTKKVGKTPYELWIPKGNNGLLFLPPENKIVVTSEIPMKVEGFKPPQEEVILVRRVDYAETFSPVADIRAIRILIAIATFYDYEIWQIDIKTASLNGYLNEDIYMVFKMDNSKHGNIPIQERFDLNKTQGASTPEEVKRMQNVPYASVVGEPHWTAVKIILKYLRNIKDIILVYDGNPEVELRVDCYCNAGLETNKDDIKSQT